MNIHRIRISIMTAIALIGGGAWWASSMNSDMGTVKRDMAEVKADVKALLRRTPEVAESKCEVKPNKEKKNGRS